MSNFIEFTQEISLKPELGAEFAAVLQNATPEKLAGWFKKKCIDMPAVECKKIIKNKTSILFSKVTARGGY